MGWTILFAVTIIFVSLVITFENREPAKTVSWLMILIFLPGVGIVLYILFGGNYRKNKLRKTKDEVAKFLGDQDIKNVLSLYDLTRAQMDAFEEDFMFVSSENSLKKKIMQLILGSERSPFTMNNQVKIYTEGVEKFEDMLRDIENAKSYIHLEYFIVKYSHIGIRVQQALIKKAKEGVRIRFLYDGLGSWRLMFHKEFVQEMKDAGIEFRSFMPMHFPYFQTKFNYRNHRKICVIDGSIGYLGGLNIGDEYIHMDPKFGFWRDTHLRLQGESVYFLQMTFLVDYYLSTKAKLMNEDFFPSINYKGDGIFQIATSGPDMAHESIYNAYFSSISQAKRNVYIQTPYFIPDEAMMMAIKTALLARVDVKIMFPSFADHRMVYHASMSYIRELVDLGAKIYLYEKGFIHSKMVLVDNEVASVGTANMDIRSFMLNFEINAFIYDDDTIRKLYDIFDEDMTYCRMMDKVPKEENTVWRRILESFARLFSPLL